MSTSLPTYCGATVHESALSNGMKVLVAERHLDPVVAVMVWYGVGGRHETPQMSGVSHFLEHMMFKGTDTLGKGAIDLETTVLGGSNNAFTTPDHTAYWFEFASDRWERALDLEADRMQSLKLDPEEFASEKQVVLEELSMGQDDPWRSLSQKVAATLFGRHPYARPVIGFRDTLIPMTAEEMRDHYDRFYRPGNATLVIAGDVDPKRALEAAEERFGKIADPELGPTDELRAQPEPALTGVVRINTTWDDQASRMIMAWPGGVFGSDDDFVFDVVVTILTGGKLSRLYRRAVVNEGLATSVSANNDARQAAGGFWIYAEAVQGVEPVAIETLIDEEVARISTDLVTDEELQRAKKLLDASDAFESETITDVAETLGEYATDLKWADALRVSERRNSVTKEMVRDTCARFLQARCRIIGWSLPAEAADAAKAASSPA